MNIAVNTRLLLKNKLEGIGWFSFESLKRITENHPEHTFYYIFDRQWDDSFITSENIIPLKAGLPTRHPFLWYLWMEFTIPKVLKKIKADIFVSPDGMLSLRTKIPQIPVIHDINFHHNPHQLPFWVRKYNNHFYKKFAKKAHHIGTVSEYSKMDIAQSYGIEPDKITVCYNGSNSSYRPITDELKRKTKEKFTNLEDYFVFVGSLNPRKNIPVLLKSFEIFKNSGNHRQKLVIVGSAMHLTGEIDTILSTMRYKEDVIFTGRLDIDNLSKVMGSAIALVYIPFFEGFGIPLVEAMYAETAIIAGNTTSLPEVAGDAALVADPDDYKAVAKHMETLVTNSGLREDLILKGKIQRQNFSWDKTAERFWSCIENGIENQTQC
ncbi:MAG: glycosyltransferase family 1 protein [Marinilabiliales bacterium]|nr:MAG: glycosyltransferase family 1 protein [Marinilabiliales bacterium]